MIKLLRFSDEGRPPVIPSRSTTSPLIAPLRATHNQILENNNPVASPLSSIDIAYFADTTHLARFRDSDVGDEVADYWRATQVVTEVPLRGEVWLADRWIDPGPRYKHIALAQRADGLTSSEFAERWKAHAGTAGATPIPTALQGLAYVQNHPDSDDDTQYDAVNEVWFDEIEAARKRHGWLTKTLAVDPDTDLFGARHLLIVKETVLAFP